MGELLADEKECCAWRREVRVSILPRSRHRASPLTSSSTDVSLCAAFALSFDNMLFRRCASSLSSAQRSWISGGTMH